MNSVIPYFFHIEIDGIQRITTSSSTHITDQINKMNFVISYFIHTEINGIQRITTSSSTPHCPNLAYTHIVQNMLPHPSNPPKLESHKDISHTVTGPISNTLSATTLSFCMLIPRLGV